MKVSDFIIDWFVKKGVDTCFTISGGACLHLADSAQYHPGMKQVFCTHEQHCGAAADGWSRIKGLPGLTITTSGPGSTNLLTSVCNAWYDSIPMIHLCGQVATNRLKIREGERQGGFQHTPIVEIFKPVTKIAHQLKSHKNIKEVLESLWCAAKEGRPGPVILDLPDDLSRAEINV